METGSTGKEDEKEEKDNNHHKTVLRKLLSPRGRLEEAVMVARERKDEVGRTASKWDKEGRAVN